MCLSKACPKCGGDFFYEKYSDGDSALVCLQCGYTFPVTTRLVGTTQVKEASNGGD